MAENEFLAAVGAYLQAAGLAPAPKTVGIAEPADAGELPAVVLSLESTAGAGNGLGARSALVTGALPWQASIDLANPVLADDPTVTLLDSGRKVLTLPHGGLVKKDGSAGPFTADDLTVQVAGAARTVADPPPTGKQVSADPVLGQLTFATKLPATGSVDVTYFLGQWEQRLERIAGTLRVDVCAASAADAAALSAAAVGALLAPGARGAVRRLLAIGATALSSVGAPEPPLSLRRRTARFAFAFENEINQPESSGGVIHRITITPELAIATAGGTGAITTTVTPVEGSELGA
ncbi:MAG TPA: hypothetical protein VOA87_17525 [Thermoanaerobaculia bacterium]|nr:hypothetical protein [Thermoanaerobaculia bacterium]